MMDFFEGSPWWLLTFAVVVGYFVVSKVVDYFVRGSTWEAPADSPSEEMDNEEMEGEITEIDEPPR